MRSSQSAFVAAVGRATFARPTPTLALKSSLSRSAFTSSRAPASAFLPNFARASTAHPHPHSVPTASAQSQQQTEWNTVIVEGLRPAAEDHVLLTINVGVTFELGSLTDAYRFPGMFVQLRPLDAEARGIKPGFFAISSPPTISGVFEFLIKLSDNTAWLEALSEGDSIESSAVMGKGFPLAKLSPQPSDILLFATGSGIAPIRSAIESVLNGVEPSKRRSVTLFYGARCTQRMAYQDRFDAWRKVGIDVVPVVSRPELCDEPWAGRTGYIQQALADVGVADPQNTAALLCGVRGMTEEVKAFLIETGIPEERILFNF